MDSIYITIIGSFLIAGFSSWFTVFLRTKYKEKPIVKVRTLLVEALNVFKEHKTYQDAQATFNVKFPPVKKRVFIVALHKLGIPIDFYDKSGFNLQKVGFFDVKIDKEEIDLMIGQVNSGMLDTYFYNDVEQYIINLSITKIRREVAKKFVTEVYFHAKRNGTSVIYGDAFITNFSFGERQILQVFKEVTCVEEFFDSNNLPIKEKLDSLCSDIEKGYYDYYLFCDWNAYQNAKNQNVVTDMIKSSIEQNKSVADMM